MPGRNMPYFFLSYARTPKVDRDDRDDPDRWVDKLYRDLRAAILQMTSARPEDAGFMDRDNRLGVAWSPELTYALATCRVFVPLYSRRYFESVNCGKEWAAFSCRKVDHKTPGRAANAIVPALWTPVDQNELPAVARSIQYSHADLGKRYDAEGFYGLTRLLQYRNDYLMAVHRLAQRIVDVARDTVVDGADPADFDSLPNIFSPAVIQQTIPRIWNVPVRNTDFTGRSATLQLLHDRLTVSGAQSVPAQALYGLGGVGKTQVALEYAHRFMSDYDLIWWIPSEHREEISLALAGLAPRMGLKVGDNVTEAAEAALGELHRDPAARWLLIFDNADDPKDLERYLPAAPGHIIITSRIQAWSHSAEPLDVDVFTSEESVAHLLLHVPGLDPAEAAKIADALGHLPLAIEQAGAWLEETGMPARVYVEQLATQSVRILSLNQPADYPMPVVATWNLSFAQLKERSPAAVRLLQLCAFLSPGPISMTLLYGDQMIASLLPYDESLDERLMLGRVIRDISRFALIRVDQGSNSLQIHRLVQAVIRAQMTEEEQLAARHEVHNILVGARPSRGETDDPANWSRYNLIWPHLGPSQAEECDDPRTRQLLIDWVGYHWGLGEFDAGLALAGRLDKLWTRQLGPDHQQTLRLRFDIANVLRSLGRFAEARELDTYVLERQRAVLGPDHPHALMTAGGLAADLRALGEFQQALASDRETYDSFKEQFGEDYPRTLNAAHNLAVSLRLVGDCFAARIIDGDTLARRRAVLGPDHPYTLYSAANFARDMREAGEYGQSVDLLRGTWEKYRAVLGDDMLDTLRTAKSLAVSLRKAGEQGEAMQLTNEIYERYKRRYGSGSPDALSCALNLASDYSGIDDQARALAIAAEVKAAYQTELGEDHPYTLAAASNMANYLRGTGQVNHARRLADETLRLMRRRLGDGHPFTLACALNYANCLSAAGDLTNSEALERETISRLATTLGPDHPDTLACKANLAITLHEAGQHEEASELKERTLDDVSRVLGPGHPDTTRLQAWHRISRDLETQPT
jgi:Tetratricopeptide repeat/TIR domain